MSKVSSVVFAACLWAVVFVLSFGCFVFDLSASLYFCVGFPVFFVESHKVELFSSQDVFVRSEQEHGRKKVGDVGTTCDSSSRINSSNSVVYGAQMEAVLRDTGL